MKLDPAIFEIHADFCHVLSSATRIMIMWLLADGEKSVTELAEALDHSVPNVSQHLRIMRDKAAVLTRKEGHSVYYRISNQKFVQGYMLIREGILEQMNLNIEELSALEE
jgi:ArsR family transcriptional regulator